MNNGGDPDGEAGNTAAEDDCFAHVHILSPAQHCGEKIHYGYLDVASSMVDKDQTSLVSSHILGLLAMEVIGDCAADPLDER